MKLFEYQAKEAFAAEGITIPRGLLCETPAAVAAAAQELGCPCVVKSQVLSGGRGKAGLIRLVRSVAEAQDYAVSLINGPHKVQRLLVEEAVDIGREIYISITVDPAAATALVLACAEGGVEIEELARDRPEKIIREAVDIDVGLLPYQARNIGYALGFDADGVKQFVPVLEALWRVFRGKDAELAEINPLFVTKASEGKPARIIAGDGKLS
ncbi:MAG: acetate--CoA ligase family protein, partial [Spirochaetes bacterium]|nr:acetate--CoA ligase family protein [Spirochaetota bacterium]